MRKVVVNFTPIIAFAKVGKLDILKDMYSRVIIPDAVFNEVTAKDDSVKAMLHGFVKLQKSIPKRTADIVF